jgi:hypothetical protein
LFLRTFNPTAFMHVRVASRSYRCQGQDCPVGLQGSNEAWDPFDNSGSAKSDDSAAGAVPNFGFSILDFGLKIRRTSL